MLLTQGSQVDMFQSRYLHVYDYCLSKGIDGMQGAQVVVNSEHTFICTKVGVNYMYMTIVCLKVLLAHVINAMLTGCCSLGRFCGVAGPACKVR